MIYQALDTHKILVSTSIHSRKKYKILLASVILISVSSLLNWKNEQETNQPQVWCGSYITANKVELQNIHIK